MKERKEELKNYTDENGEVYTYLYPDGIATLKKIYVKEFIWRSFNGDIPEGMKIVHIDGNKANNTLAAAGWVIYKYEGEGTNSVMLTIVQKEPEPDGEADFCRKRRNNG